MPEKLMPAGVRKAKAAKAEKPVKKDKKERKSNGPRKSVLVSVNGEYMRLQDFCAENDLVLSTVYNRIRGLFAQNGDKTAMVLPSTHPVFSAERNTNSSGCYAIMSNGAVIKCRVNEAQVRDYQIIVTKKGFYIPGEEMQDFATIEDFDAAVVEPEQPTEEAEAEVEEVAE